MASKPSREDDLVTPLELLRQTSSRENELITANEFIRQTVGKSPTRPLKRDDNRKLAGLAALPAPPSPKSSPTGSSSSPPSSPHTNDAPLQLPAHALLRRKSDPKGSSPLALNTITCEDAPSPPMSPTSPTKSNDSRPASPTSTATAKQPEFTFLRKVAAERVRKGSRIISFLDRAPAAAAKPKAPCMPYEPPPGTGDFLGISRRRAQSFVIPMSSEQWSANDAARLAVLVDKFDRFVASRQAPPMPLARQRTRTMAFTGAPILSMRPGGHQRRGSLPTDFGIRNPEPLSLSESAPHLSLTQLSSLSLPRGTGTKSPRSDKKEKKEKKDKKEKKTKKSRSMIRSAEGIVIGSAAAAAVAAEEPANAEEIKRPQSPPPGVQDAPLDRVSSVEPPVLEATDLHSYIVALLSPSSALTTQTFKETVDWLLLGYRQHATPVELAASIHVIWTFAASLTPAEAQVQEQNILYIITRWITLNYESDFVQENGLPDQVTQKALNELLTRASDENQYRFKQLVEEQQKESRPVGVATIARRKGRIPIGLKKADFSFVCLLDTSELARCLTMLEWEMMTRVRRTELLSKAYPHLQKNCVFPMLPIVTARWNAVQTWVTAEIVTLPKLKQRTIVVERFIALAAALLDEQQNYHTFFAVMLGMKDACVQRMKGTWKRVSSSFALLFSKLDRLTDLMGGYKLYRASLKDLKRQKVPAIVPFIVVPISDLVLLSNVPDHIEGSALINWHKTANVGRVIAEFEEMQRGCRKALTESTLSDADLAIIRLLPQMRVERFELITDNFLYEQSKLHEPTVML